MTANEDSFSLVKDILPIVAFDKNKEQMVDFLGTGFLFTDNRVMTCWH